MILTELIRPELLGIKPYSSARDEFVGAASVFLDANENPYNNGVNRYPDPLQKALKKRISELKKVDPEKLFLGNGSDECIDLLFRLFCVPGKDVVAAISPSYGMYSVSARINNITLREILLNEDFSLPVDRILTESKGAKLLFVCSPNNPTGNAFSREELLLLANGFDGILVIDEAYIDFSDIPSMTEFIDTFSNIVVAQTLSKAYGMAGIRLGIMVGSEELISWINKIKPPYNVNVLSQEFALKQLENIETTERQIKSIISEREKLIELLSQIKEIRKIYPSDANFVLIRVANAGDMYTYLTQQGIVVRNRSSQPLCDNTLRLTVGTKEENVKLISAMRTYFNS